MRLSGGNKEPRNGARNWPVMGVNVRRWNGGYASLAAVEIHESDQAPAPAQTTLLRNVAEHVYCPPALLLIGLCQNCARTPSVEAAGVAV